VCEQTLIQECLPQHQVLLRCRPAGALHAAMCACADLCSFGYDGVFVACKWQYCSSNAFVLCVVVCTLVMAVRRLCGCSDGAQMVVPFRRLEWTRVLQIRARRGEGGTFLGRQGILC
jgi:hypothetical protein